MPKQPKPEREKLTIIEVKPVQDGVRGDGGAWHNLAFKGYDGDSEMWYACYVTDLHSYLVPGAVLEAGVAVKDTERGIFRNVVMVYKDGQPVVQKRSGFSRGKSPEEIASEENQTRAKIIAELWFRGKYLDIDPKVTWLNQWLTGAQPIVSKPPEAPKSETATARTDATNTRKPGFTAGFETEFLTHSMKVLQWSITKFIQEYALKFGVKNPADSLPEFLDNLTQKQRDDLSIDLQDRVYKAEAKA